MIIRKIELSILVIAILSTGCYSEPLLYPTAQPITVIAPKITEVVEKPNLISPVTASQVELLTTLEGHDDYVSGLVFSSDGHLISGSWDSTIRIWDLEKEAALDTLTGHTDGIHRLAIFEDDTLVSVSFDETLRLWNVSNREEIFTISGEPFTRGLAVFPGSEVLAYGVGEGPVTIWDFTSESAILSFDGPIGGAYDLGVSMDGKLLASSSSQGMTSVWETETGQEVAALSNEIGVSHRVAFSPTSNLLAIGEGQNSRVINLWDAGSREFIHSLRGGGGVMWHLSFSPDGKILAAAWGNRTVQLWDVSTGKSLKILKHSDEVLMVVFSPDGKLLASGGFDNLVYVWGIPQQIDEELVE